MVYWDLLWSTLTTIMIYSIMDYYGLFYWGLLCSIGPILFCSTCTHFVTSHISILPWLVPIAKRCDEDDSANDDEYEYEEEEENEEEEEEEIGFLHAQDTDVTYIITRRVIWMS